MSAHDDDAPPLLSEPPDDPYGPAEVVHLRPPRRQQAGDVQDALDAAEQYVIGGMLLDKSAIDEVTAIISDPAAFYGPAHETIFRAILTLSSASAPVTAVTVADQLAEQGDLSRIGGMVYLHTLISGTASSANAGYYAEIVRDRSMRRRLVEAGTRIAQLGRTEGDGEPETIAAAATAELQNVLDAYSDAVATTRSSWEPMDLSEVDLDSVIEPQLLTRSDGIHLLYEGAVHSIVGEPGSAKSWFGLLGAVQLIKTGQDVAMLDFEDRPGPVVRRLLDMGCTREEVFTHFRYLRPDVMLTSATHGHLERAVTGCRLTILDGVTEAMTLHGLSLMDNEDVAKFLALLPRRVADTGSSVLQVDHVVKNADDRGRYGIGAQHKLAGIDGAQFKITVVENFGRGKRGKAKITIDKDRHGGVEQHSQGIAIADLVLDSKGPENTVGPLRVYLDPPDTSAIGPEGEFRPTHLMAQISDYIGLVPSCSQTDIEKNVPGGKRETKRAAIRQLVSEGYVRIELGPRDSHKHFQISPFTEDGIPPW